jgi:hypothetical protein
MKTLLLLTLFFTASFNAFANPMHDLSTVIAKRKYDKTLADIEKYRKTLKRKYHSANTAKKAELLKQADEYLTEQLIGNVFPAWYGTPWDFNGTSQTPGEGLIACGYFVSAPLIHLGFKFNRIKMSQQASSRIILSFIEKPTLIRTHQITIYEFLDKVEHEQGNGIYIVGLDTHTGFLHVKDGQYRFIHSSYFPMKRYVLSEDAIGLNPLSISKWRYAGKLFAPHMIKKWLNEQTFAVYQ